MSCGLLSHDCCNPIGGAKILGQSQQKNGWPARPNHYLVNKKWVGLELLMTPLALLESRLEYCKSG